MSKEITDDEVQWKKQQENGEWTSYEDKQNELIENAYQKKQKTVKIGKDVVVHFSDLTERKKKRKSTLQRDVKQKRLKVKPVVLAKELLEALRGEELTNCVDLKRSLETYILNIEYLETLPPPKEYVQTRGFNADELYDITSQLDNGPITSWSEEQIAKTIERIRQVNCYFMRGTPQAKLALEKFHKEWLDYVTNNLKVRQILDPEVIVFDVDWTPPASWPIATSHANNNLNNPMLGLAIPPAPEIPLPNTPAIPPGGVSSIAFSNAGVVPDAQHFGGFVLGANINHARGYWRINTAVAPVYY